MLIDCKHENAFENENEPNYSNSFVTYKLTWNSIISTFVANIFFCLYSSVTKVCDLSSKTLSSSTSSSMCLIFTSQCSWWRPPPNSAPSVLAVTNYLAPAGVSDLIFRTCLTPALCAVTELHHALHTMIYFCMRLLHCRAILGAVLGLPYYTLMR